jgi:hypothetical protein
MYNKSKPILIPVATLLMLVIGSFSLKGQTKSIDHVISDVARAFVVNDTTIIQAYLMSEEEFFSIQDKVNFDSLGVERPTESTMKEDLKMARSMVIMMFAFEALKFNSLEIELNLDSLQYEIVELPLEGNTRMVHLRTENEGFKWLQFILTVINNEYKISIPFFKLSEEKVKID